MAYDPGQKHRKSSAPTKASEGKEARHQETPLEQEGAALKGPVYMELSIHIYQSIDFLQKLEIPLEQVEEKGLDIQWTKPHVRKLLLLDLDETLAHCVKKPHPDRKPHVFLNLTTPSGGTIRAGFNVRPYCQELLEAANKNYEVCVFTASTPLYADTILNYLDPTGQLIQHRFYRPSCVRTADGEYIKDLRIFRNVSLKDMLLVDNAVYSFGAQLSNGIPIPSFKEDPDDIEFLHLIKYLDKCAACDDVREMNRAAFQLSAMFQHPFDDFVEYYYDLEDCEQLMAEERTRADEERGRIENDSAHAEYVVSSTGSTAGRPKKLPPKSVGDCLDGLSAILRECGGRLPV